MSLDRVHEGITTQAHKFIPNNIKEYTMNIFKNIIKGIDKSLDNVQANNKRARSISHNTFEQAKLESKRKAEQRQRQLNK